MRNRFWRVPAADQLGRFLEACTEHAPGERVQSSVLHEVFNAWSVANALNPWKDRGFLRRDDGAGLPDG